MVAGSLRRRRRGYSTTLTGVVVAHIWDEWQELLEERFFSGASDCLPFVMFVDTDELTDLDGDGA